jgi:hypothetical protein
MLGKQSVEELLDQFEQMGLKVERELANSKVDWLWRPGKDEWSLTEVICHLRDVEREVHQRRFRDLITKDNVFIQGVSADEWARERAYQNQDGPIALRVFIELRRETMTLLAGLDEIMWNRKGRHAFLGQTSMYELLQIAVRHDEIHWGQISRLIGEQQM